MHACTRTHTHTHALTRMHARTLPMQESMRRLLLAMMCLAVEDDDSDDDDGPSQGATASARPTPRAM